MSEFKVGDPVLLTLDSPGPVGITEGLKHYQDMRFRISRVRTIQGGKAVTRGTYYEQRITSSRAAYRTRAFLTQSLRTG